MWALWTAQDLKTKGYTSVPWTWGRLYSYVKRVEKVNGICEQYASKSEDPESVYPPRAWFWDDDRLKWHFTELAKAMDQHGRQYQ